MKYYKVIVRVEHVIEDKVKPTNEEYIIKAVSVTDAEVKANELFKGSTLDFTVSSVSATKIVDVIN